MRSLALASTLVLLANAAPAAAGRRRQPPAPTRPMVGSTERHESHPATPADVRTEVSLGGVRVVQQRQMALQVRAVPTAKVRRTAEGPRGRRYSVDLDETTGGVTDERQTWGTRSRLYTLTRSGPAASLQLHVASRNVIGGEDGLQFESEVSLSRALDGTILTHMATGPRARAMLATARRILATEQHAVPEALRRPRLAGEPSDAEMTSEPVLWRGTPPGRER